MGAHITILLTEEPKIACVIVRMLSCPGSSVPVLNWQVNHHSFEETVCFCLALTLT